MKAVKHIHELAETSRNKGGAPSAAVISDHWRRGRLRAAGEVPT
jgi:hypothetical protein